MDDLDRTFERLKKEDFNNLVERVSNKFTVNPYTFELTLHKLYHHVITGCGWTIEEFLNEVNDRRYK